MTPVLKEIHHFAGLRLKTPPPPKKANVMCTVDIWGPLALGGVQSVHLLSIEVEEAGIDEWVMSRHGGESERHLSAQNRGPRATCFFWGLYQENPL